MDRPGRMPVFLLVLLLASLLVGSHVGPTSATHLGGSNATLFDSSVAQPIGVAATPGRAFVTGPYCLNPTDSDASNNEVKVFIFDDRTPSPRVFNTTALPQQGTGCFENYIAVAGPKDPSAGGFPSPTRASPTPYKTNFVYVTQGQRVIELTETGVVARNPFVNIPDCGSDRAGITFDHVGTFQYNMIVTCVTGKVYKVTNATSGLGTAMLIADVRQALGLQAVVIENPEVAPQATQGTPGFGVFGGQIIVAAPSLDRFLAIASNGTVTRLDKWRSAEAVNFVPLAKCGFLNTTATFFTAVHAPTLGPPGTYRFPVSAFQNLGLNISAKAIVTSGANAGMGVLEPTANGTRITAFDSIGSNHEGAAFVACDVPRFFEIRTDPGGNTPKSINPRSSGTILFAILSSLNFDPSTIVLDSDPSHPSPTYGFTGNENSVEFASCDFRDVNHDGRLDRICKAKISRLGIPGTGVYTGTLIAKFRYIGPGGDPDGEGFN